MLPPPKKSRIMQFFLHFTATTFYMAPCEKAFHDACDHSPAPFTMCARCGDPCVQRECVLCTDSVCLTCKRLYVKTWHSNLRLCPPCCGLFLPPVVHAYSICDTTPQPTRARPAIPCFRSLPTHHIGPVVPRPSHGPILDLTPVTPLSQPSDDDSGTETFADLLNDSHLDPWF